MDTSDSPSAHPTKQILIILCGLIGSGKSTLATALEREYPEFRRCNQDELGRRGDVEREARLALSRGLSVCIDRTNFDQSQRRTWIELAHQYPQVEIWGLQMDTPYDICRARLIGRKDHPTIKTVEQALQVLSRFAADFIPIHPSEGFNRTFALPPHHSPEYSREDVENILSAIRDTPFIDATLPSAPATNYTPRGRDSVHTGRGFNPNRGRGSFPDRGRGPFPHRGRGQPRGGTYAPRGSYAPRGAGAGTWRSSPSPSPAGTAPARAAPTSPQTRTQNQTPPSTSGAWRSFDNYNSRGRGNYSHTRADTRQPYTPEIRSYPQAGDGPPAGTQGDQQGSGNPRDAPPNLIANDPVPNEEDLPRAGADERSFRSPGIGIGTGTGDSTLIVDAPGGTETGVAESSH